jgi:DNA-binding CsgD family transcriptional regulator
MPGLTTRDLARVLSWADDLLTVGAYEHVPGAVLAGAARTVGADTATLTHVDLRSGHEVAVPWPPSRPLGAALAAYPALSHTHPLRGPAVQEAATTSGTRRTSPVRISDVMSRSAWRGSALRTEAMPDVDDQMAVPLLLRDGVLHALTLGRSHGTFTDRQRDVLAHGSAHVHAAVRRAAAHNASTATWDGGGPVGLQLTPRPEWVPLNTAPGLRRPGRTATAPGGDPTATLSPRELQVLGLVAQGLTDAQVARRLGLRTATVSRHLHRVYARHGVTNRVAAVALLPPGTMG